MVRYVKLFWGDKQKQNKESRLYSCNKQILESQEGESKRIPLQELLIMSTNIMSLAFCADVKLVICCKPYSLQTDDTMPERIWRPPLSISPTPDSCRLPHHGQREEWRVITSASLQATASIRLCGHPGLAQRGACTVVPWLTFLHTDFQACALKGDVRLCSSSCVQCQ